MKSFSLTKILLLFFLAMLLCEYSFEMKISNEPAVVKKSTANDKTVRKSSQAPAQSTSQSVISQGSSSAASGSLAVSSHSSGSVETSSHIITTSTSVIETVIDTSHTTVSNSPTITTVGSSQVVTPPPPQPPKAVTPPPPQPPKAETPPPQPPKTVTPPPPKPPKTETPPPKAVTPPPPQPPKTETPPPQPPKTVTPPPPKPAETSTTVTTQSQTTSDTTQTAKINCKEPKEAAAVVFEPVELVKHLTPAGKAALEQTRDNDYLAIVGSGYETPSFTTEIIKKSPTEVKTPSHVPVYTYSSPESNVWQNVEYHRYGNNLIESHHFLTPAEFQVNNFGRITAKAPIESSIRVISSVPQIQAINFLDLEDKLKTPRSEDNLDEEPEESFEREDSVFNHFLESID